MGINNTEGVRKEIKFKIFSIGTQRMWNMKCFVTPLNIGAEGIVTRGLKAILEQYQESIQ
jgi:hypothetical protein